MKTGINDETLTTGNEDLIGQELEGVEFDDSLLFGDDEEGEDFADYTEESTDEKTAVEDQGGDDNQPEVIDTTLENQTGDGNQNDGGDNGAADNQQANDDNVKEIDGKLYVAVDANNSQIMGKDGKHNIPYQVLERARQQGTDSQSRLKELEGEVADYKGKYEQTSQKQELFAKQLEAAGIDPEKLPEEVLNDPEAMQRIKDELPGEAGQILEALVGRLNAQPQNQAPQHEQAPAQAEGQQHPVDAALASDGLKELNGWQQGDQNRWDMALVIDKQLQNDPAFSQLPMDQRFAEVQRRTKAAFGDPIQEGINQELANQGQREQAAKQQGLPAAQQPPQAIPNSPSEISGGGGNAPTGHQALAEQDPMAMEAAMGNMTEAQLEAFLEEAGGAFE